MDTFTVESIRIGAPFASVFDYAADASKLPEWTHAFKAVNDGRATMATPAGSVEVGLRVTSSRSQGTVDWHITFPDGNVASAFSRVVPESAESCIFSFVLLAPPVPLEQLEGTLNEQAKILRLELRKLDETVTRSRKAS